MTKKTKAEILKEKLCYKSENCYTTMSEKEISDAFHYCEGYKSFLDKAKTEREAVSFVMRQSVNKGFSEFNPKKEYKAGDRIYFVNRECSLILAVIGTEPLEKGISLAASHLGSPRLDLKPSSLSDLGYLLVACRA